jgi:hypothetical protein
MKSCSWLGREIWGMIRILAVNCTPILGSFKDDGKTAAETVSDEMVLRAVQTLCEFSLLDTQQHQLYQSLTA